MAGKEKNNEQLILEAAEVEFIEKGYASAKTTDIARRAGVTHAMLHYYFRTKENLFAVVFQGKVELFVNTLLLSFDQQLPFMDKLRKGIESHFDLIAAHPRLPYFIFSEILTNEERRNSFFAVLRPKVARMMERVSEEINAEVAKGRIRPVAPVDLLLNVLSLNVFFFVAQPIVGGLFGLNEKQNKALLEHRRQSNVELILGQLKK